MPVRLHARTIELGSSRRYELVAEIASGGMGTVYLGRACGIAGFERVVAIKCCHPHLKSDREFSEMFLDEARLAARLHHPNVVPTVDVGEADVLYLVMEYVEGDRLSNLVRAARERGGRIPTSITLRIAIEMLSGLHAAHELRGADGQLLNLVHRDVTPQNVMVGTDGVSRILDFGIAKAVARATVTREGYVKGKLGYMAPEQLAGQDASRQSDIYSAGVVLWEALTGARLFQCATDAETVTRVLRGAIPRPSEVCPSVEPALDAIVLRALAREPARRYGTAAEVAESLERCGVAAATSRSVGSYIEQMLGDKLAELRARLKDAAALSTGPRDSEALTLSKTAPSTQRRSDRTRIAVVAAVLGAVAAAALFGGVIVGSADRSQSARRVAAERARREPMQGAAPAAPAATAATSPTPGPTDGPTPADAGAPTGASARSLATSARARVRERARAVRASRRLAAPASAAPPAQSNREWWPSEL